MHAVQLRIRFAALSFARLTCQSRACPIDADSSKAGLTSVHFAFGTSPLYRSTSRLHYHFASSSNFLSYFACGAAQYISNCLPRFFTAYATATYRFSLRILRATL